ncbi:Glucose-repressible alcohol dehydrogenase transcriptional effector [Mortierella alpina]|uniref:Glucose-repressible alcohol dehydrogenase transcriptional effector n=1 Tax=Mortierella alpina TaxID=64518 RepID=A0A9P6LWV2_MORAP|nr:Glucose-repressible alcohol dehydrogenase transcriptional effector [Mortierella alpina]
MPATLVSDCPIPFPQGVVKGAEVPGVMLVLDVKVGQNLQRVCVATTHIPCNDSQGGLKRVGQVMALLSAAADLLRRNPYMAFILMGDFNLKRSDKLIKFITTGSLDLAQMKAPRATLKAFMAQTQPLRDVLAPPRSVSTEPSPNQIESDVDLETMVVSHPMHTASVYSMKSIVDYIFYGSITGGRELEVVARLELPERLEQLKAGLPAGHLGSDHLALGAKFRIADRAVRLEWTGTPGYIPLVGYRGNVVEVVVPTGRKRYFPFEVRQKPAEEVKSPWDNEPYTVGTLDD